MTSIDTSNGADMARRRKPARGTQDPAVVEFGRRLEHYTSEKGWNQSDLAREASKHLQGKELRRDNISLYTRGIQMPGPVRLRALCKALGVTESDLVAPGAAMSMESPPLAMKPVDATNVWLQINRSVPLEVALKIVALLSEKPGK